MHDDKHSFFFPFFHSGSHSSMGYVARCMPSHSSRHKMRLLGMFHWRDYVTLSLAQQEVWGSRHHCVVSPVRATACVWYHCACHLLCSLHVATFTQTMQRAALYCTVPQCMCGTVTSVQCLCMGCIWRARHAPRRVSSSDHGGHVAEQPYVDACLSILPKSLKRYSMMART